MSGRFLEKGDLLQDEETRKLRQVDFDGGYAPSDISKKAQKHQKQWIQSASAPQHSYYPFYGQESNFSYVLFMPDQKAEDAISFVVCNKKGRHCDSGQMNEIAELLCEFYQPQLSQVWMDDSGIGSALFAEMSGHTGWARSPMDDLNEFHTYNKSTKELQPVDELEMME